MQPIIIIGAGLAGYTVAREVRKLDKEIPLTIITSCGGGFYSKPMLSNAFAKNQQAAQLVTQSAVQMAAQLNATVAADTHVQSIDTAGKQIHTDKGVFAYGKLVIASGAQPIRIPIEGDAAHQVISINHVEDYAVFRSRIDQAAVGRPARVTILGAGLIGCEFADDLAGTGHAVTLIDPNPLPLAALASPALSEKLQSALSERGVTFCLGTTASRVDHRGDALHVSLANGTSFETDIVLSAVGLRPDIRLAQAAQLQTGRGILVDQTGQTSASDIFAVGDCAEYMADNGTTQILPYVAPLMTAARAIARTLTGQVTQIDLQPAPVLVKTPSCPLALIPPPVALAKTGHWETQIQIENGRIISRYYDAQGIMRGFGVTPHDAAVRQALLNELGSTRPVSAASQAS
ncbi:FAD-dependent oxidoreductase [Oxalobacteraceae bacterium R-40]|uniref:FAD-dependent oxidoreductase n=1 Tax=Keguizhuia sedimenti TaxID=3064264 RepID=A0ABU1BPK7_9BURK|nr:FAD-dependent oxidoreductase [Oxalobacteraceae bacterium R-40]